MKEVELQKTTIKTFPYNNPEPVPFLGKYEAVIAIATFYAAKGANSGNFLSLSMAQDLDLVQLHLHQLSAKNSIISKILNKHVSAFTSL